MAKQFPSIAPDLRDFILRQRVFFIASAAADGRVNVSPKNVDALRVLGENSVAYLDLTGSGNETAAHLRLNNRLTLMFCAFEGPPKILRLYGSGRIVPRRGSEYRKLLTAQFAGVEPPGARQMVALNVDRVQTSCGYGVPLFDYVGERPTLTRWAEAKSEEELEEYWRRKNTHSIDGLPTGLLEEVETQ